LSSVIAPRFLFEELARRDMRFFAGVPDSLLKDFCAYVEDHAESGCHVITANEGGAVALGAGHHLATGRTPVVYMQNSGLGNALNPLLSLADPAVYALPVLLLIGWRGEPGVHDEPQHVKQGRVTCGLLEAAGIPHVVVEGGEEGVAATLDEVVRSLAARPGPHALVFRAGAFAPYPGPGAERPRRAARPSGADGLDRRRALVALLDAAPGDAVVATTGKISRELMELRAARGEPPDTDFLVVGSMGHVSQIALGIALARPERRVLCVDGDGSALMHLGGLAIVAAARPANLVHVILNNGCHESVGGQPTVGFAVDFPALARAAGYAHAETVRAAGDVAAALARARAADGVALVEVRIDPGGSGNLGRPGRPLAELKDLFVKALERR
jgi:phosphonopyruvate decarboxylase